MRLTQNYFTNRADPSKQEDAVKAQDLIREWANKDGRKLGWIADQVPVAKSSMSRWMQRNITPGAIYRNRLAEITGLDSLRDKGTWK